MERRDSGVRLKNPAEALVLASIIEKESDGLSDRRQISQVFHLRLQKNMRLQTDPTVIYALGKAFMVTYGAGIFGLIHRLILIAIGGCLYTHCSAFKGLDRGRFCSRRLGITCTLLRGVTVPVNSPVHWRNIMLLFVVTSYPKKGRNSVL